MRKLLLIGWALAFVLLASGRAQAQITDRQLLEKISNAIQNYPKYSVFDSIEVGIDNRAVVIGGRVTSPQKRDEIEKRVSKIDGIRSLTNEIGVLPLSQGDNDLRRRVAAAIYNHPMFWTYAQMPVPPIHIVVEGGRITLTGVADSEVQRVMAASLAVVSGSFGVTNRISVERR